MRSDLFEIDEQKCLKDGICANVCPMEIIHHEADKCPRPAAGAETSCIECGHCVAVCPQGAFHHRIMGPDDCPLSPVTPPVSSESLEFFYRYRRSIRVYKSKPVEKELICRLIHLASYAPSGHNAQPVKWHVIYSADKVGEIAASVIDWMKNISKRHPAILSSMDLEPVIDAWEKGRDRICRGAPHLILAYGEKGSSVVQSACVIAMTHLDLAAPCFGLGTCWAGFVTAAAQRWAPLKELLGLPPGHSCFAAMMIGYPKFKYKRLPLRKPPQITWDED